MKRKTKKNTTRELAEELDVFDSMLSVLIEILEEKGILTQEEWEKRLKQKLEKTKRKLSYREIQFQNREE